MLDHRSRCSLTILVVAVTLLVGCRPSSVPIHSSDKPLSKIRVKLVIRFSDHSVDATVGSPIAASDDRSNRDALDDIETEMEIFSGETVHDVLMRLMAEGTVSVDWTGEGETVFVHAIGGVRNRGPGQANWTYRINGELVKKSCGVASMADGDRVEWVFGPVQMN